MAVGTKTTHHREKTEKVKMVAQTLRERERSRSAGGDGASGRELHALEEHRVEDGGEGEGKEREGAKGDCGSEEDESVSEAG